MFYAHFYCVFQAENLLLDSDMNIKIAGLFGCNAVTPSPVAYIQSSEICGIISLVEGLN